MAEISRLLEIFQEDKAPKDLAQRLCSDSIRPGLERFLAILDVGIGDAGGGRLGFESWSRSQIEAVVSVSRLIVSALGFASVAEEVESVLVAILEKSLEFCISFLEKSVFEGDDFSLLNIVVQFLQSVLADGIFREYPNPVNSYVEQLSIVPVNHGTVELANNPICSLQGFHCLKDANLVERLLVTLPSEFFQSENTVAELKDSPHRVVSDCSTPLAQHIAVVHVKCLPRLLVLCKEMLWPSISFDELKEDTNFSLRLSFSQKILKLVRNLAQEIPHDMRDAGLLCAVASCADTLPTLFRLKVDFVNCDLVTAGDEIGGLLLQILEEFLQFVQIVFHDGNVFQNIQTCMIASMMDILDSNVWRYDGSCSLPRPPLVYCPEIVLYLLKLLRDPKNWRSQTHDLKEESDSSDYLCKSEANIPVCHVRSEQVFVLRKYTCEEYMSLIFPKSKQWIDGLIHLAFFLHLQGVKSRSMADKSRLTCTKPAITLDQESAASHEDEAIFGDLFSESSRPAGMADGLDQPTAVATGISGSPHLPIQAAAELLNFLKMCVFSPEWNHAVCEDACRKVDTGHINQLLSILNCQSCLSGERNSENSAALHSQTTFLHINDICFELLHGLIVRHALSNSLKEHLVDQVLKVENGMHVYNRYTLTLLAHALISRADLDGTLTIKIYERYINFVLEKAKNICCICPDPSDFFSTLPCAFHLEILLIAFHLSDEADKIALANSVLSSIKKNRCSSN